MLRFLRGYLFFLPEEHRENPFLKLIFGAILAVIGYFFVPFKYAKLAMVLIGLVIYIAPGISGVVTTIADAIKRKLRRN